MVGGHIQPARFRIHARPRPFRPAIDVKEQGWPSLGARQEPTGAHALEKRPGVFGCRTGKQIYKERLGNGSNGFTASPVASEGKLYFTSEQGSVFVVKPGVDFAMLATNRMGEVCMATPAISEGAIFFRTQGHVVAVGDRK